MDCVHCTCKQRGVEGVWCPEISEKRIFKHAQRCVCLRANSHNREESMHYLYTIIPPKLMSRVCCTGTAHMVELWNFRISDWKSRVIHAVLYVCVHMISQVICTVLSICVSIVSPNGTVCTIALHRCLCSYILTLKNSFKFRLLYAQCTGVCVS